MPKIIVRERDNTTPGLGEYSNYSVLVPGFSLKSDVFDENGIAEFSSASDFVTRVGKVAPVAFPTDFNYFVKNIGDQNYQATEEFSGANDKWYRVSDYGDANTETVKRRSSFTFTISNADHGQATIRLTAKGAVAEVTNTSLWNIEDDNLKFISLTLKNNQTNVESIVQFDADGTYDFTLGQGETVTVTATYLGALPETNTFFEGFYNPEINGNQHPYGYSEYNFEVTAQGNAQTPTVTGLPNINPGEHQNSQPSLWLGVKNIKETKATVAEEENANNITAAIAAPGSEKSPDCYFPAVPAHYGNQIAYSLLSIGCPVVYLNLGTLKENPTDFNGSADSATRKYAECQYDINTGLQKLVNDATWAPLRDKAQYDFRFAVTGLINGFAGSSVKRTAGNSLLVKAEKAITNLCAFQYDTSEADIDETTIAVRGDATALLDVDEDLINAAIVGQRTQTSIINAIKRAVRDVGINNKYAAFFVPSVCYAGIGEAEYANNNKLPASFHYLACFTRSIAAGNPEWFAPAGLSRGLSDWAVEGTAYDLGEIAVNALEPRAASITSPIKCNVACNVIVRVRNAYYLWGNRTAYQLGDVGSADGDLIASHFLNIRQLCTTLKKQIYVACRRTIFDPNSDILWLRFCNAIRPTLEFMKSNQGIDDYKIMPVETNQKGKLKAKVRIVPIEAVEDFDIEVSLEDSLGAVAATITE